MEGIKAFVNEWGFTMILILVFASAAVFVVREYLRQRRYDRSPAFEGKAKLLSKHTGSGNSGPRPYPTFFGVFETEFGDLLELGVPAGLYATVSEGTELIITWKAGKVEDYREVEK